MLCLRCNPNSTQWCEWTGAQIFRQNHTRIKKTKKPSNRVTVLPLGRKKIPKELKEKKYYEVTAITETKVYTPLKALMISFLMKVIIFFKSTKCTRWCENDIGLLHLFHYYELTNWRQFFMRLSCYWQWIHSYFDNVMTKFIVNNRTDAWKTDVHLFFTITER